MVETEGDASDGFVVLDDQIETVLVIHNGSQAHDGDVDVVFGVAHLELCDVLGGPLHTGRVDHQLLARFIRGWRRRR